LIAALVEFVSVPPTIVCAVPDANPEIPVIAAGADHEYVVPVGTIFPLPFVGATLNAAPEQMAAVCAETVGVGLTVTVTVNVAPEHEPEIGVTV
jgi:hypothetical protein